MTVSVVEQVQSTGIAVGTSIGSAQGLTLTTTPVAGDVLVLVHKSLGVNNQPVVSVTGCGATWAPGYSGTRIHFWTGTGATTAGAITLTQTSGDAQATVYNVRGLTSGAISDGQTASAGGTTLAGVSQTAYLNQIVIASGIVAAASGGVGLTYPSSQTPSGWTTASIVSSSIGKAGDAYRIPTTTAAHTTSTTVSTSATQEVSSILLGVSGATGTAAVDAVIVHALGHGVSDARVDAVIAHALMPAYEPELAQFTIAARDVFPLAETAPFTMSATSTGFTLAGGTDLWIPATLPTQPMLVWLPDPPPSLELPSEGAWG